MKFLALISIIIPFLIGGVITGNILGDMKQKTGEIVFYLWKGIQVFRKKVIPANPQSVPQVAQRTLFSSVLFVGQDLLLPVLKVFWKSLAVKMSEMNAFMKYNLLAQTGVFDPQQLILAIGSIPFTEITSATYDPSSGATTINFSASAGAGQETTDLAYGAVYNPDSKLWYFILTGLALRSAGKVALTLPTGWSEEVAEACVAYLWFTDKSVQLSGFKVSDSSNSLLTSI